MGYTTTTSRVSTILYAVVSDLGKRFEVEGMGFKAYPSCGYTHGPIFSTLTLMKENGIKPDDVLEINVSTGKNAADLFEPSERKRRPPGCT